MFASVPDIIAHISCVQNLTYRISNANANSYKSAFCPKRGFICQFDTNPKVTSSCPTGNCGIDLSKVTDKYILNADCGLRKTCCS